MIAAAWSNVTFVILDRPNLITGSDAFGLVLNESFANSYISRVAVARARAVTVGEVAEMSVGDGWIQDVASGSDLHSLKVI